MQFTKDHVRIAAGPRYPEIEVNLVGESGNAFMILGLVGKALKDAGIEKEERDEFQNEAMSGDYDNLLRTAMNWVTVN